MTHPPASKGGIGWLAPRRLPLLCRLGRHRERRAQSMTKATHNLLCLIYCQRCGHWLRNAP